MSEFQNQPTNPNQPPEPYYIPEEIREGEFRDKTGEPDPSFRYAVDLVTARLGERPDPSIVDEVYREVARARAAFEDIRSKENSDQPIDAEPYFRVTTFFGNRIERILTGDIFE